MPINNFECAYCYRRCINEHGYHLGIDDDGYSVYDTFICEDCAEAAEFSNAFHEDEANRIKELSDEKAR